MSSNAPLPRTAVPLGIDDPVESARAELKAALLAIEEKANVPRRVAVATDRTITDARAFSQRNPAAAAAVVVAGAVAIGIGVWGLVRLYTR
ncbi:hypothetical protein [Microbacterium xanthum]|uniref:hypothetical protein n=1 Tax=Microbacterium xanthum TaxID=3079794 RepID=UPI002AD227C8|nr:MULTISPECIES: hypothetical protein [unclassified Microbacterium]MDZ8172908.1 hypothetical protein [Microbacterium sp. KSW-48]MDZ8200960.1 hypothetical protein [Microbacterium sp. SSW1-59]